jgi:hypothetical protein
VTLELIQVVLEVVCCVCVGVLCVRWCVIGVGH